MNKETLIYRIIGAAIEVHRELGNGFLEGVYQEAMALEMKDRNIPFEREKQISIQYKGRALDKKYFADFVSDNIIIELKAVSALLPEHQAQLLNYLKATNTHKGIIINFGSPKLDYKSMVL